MSDIKHTPLTDVHKALGAKMVDFAGYLMPVAYGSIIEEHNAVRSNVGIFDVSHMGEFLVTGPGARKFVNEIVTNDVGRMEPGALLYTVMCTERGTVVDDLLVFLM
jgi:aminomethyltransferase